MKLGQLNVDPDHLSHIQTREEPTNIDDGFPDVQLFHVDITDDHYALIIQILATDVALENLSTSQKKQLVIKDSYFQLIV